MIKEVQLDIESCLGELKEHGCDIDKTTLGIASSSTKEWEILSIYSDPDSNTVWFDIQESQG
jgi:hypothetical protein